MQMAVNITQLYHLPCLAEIEQVIEDNLTHNWEIRIEYTSELKRYNTEWKQWGKSHFALKDSSPVVRDIITCHMRHADHSIRLYAEKFQPKMKFVYPVYRPGDESSADQSTVATRLPVFDNRYSNIDER